MLHLLRNRGSIIFQIELGLNFKKQIGFNEPFNNMTIIMSVSINYILFILSLYLSHLGILFVYKRRPKKLRINIISLFA